MSDHTLTAGRYVGQSVQRKEDPRLLTGHGRYVDDIVVPRMLHAAFVRSDLAAADITGIDVSEALALEGVVAVYTGADLNDGVGSMQPSMMAEDPNAVCPPVRPLALTDVRFVGDTVAIVVAESRAIAEDAVELVVVDYEPKPAVASLEAAIAEGAPLVHPEFGTNVAMDVPLPPDPEIEAIFSSAAHVVSERIVQHRHLPMPMEGRGVIASYDHVTGDLDVWLSTQGPHEARRTLSRLTGVPEHRIRVQMGDVGGGFGLKFFLTREEQVVVLASKRLGRSVKWIEDRRENLLASVHARSDIADVSLALDADGRFLAAKLDHLEETGAFPMGGLGGVGPFVAMLFPGPYRLPKVWWRSRSVFTNTSGRGAYRGPWMFETTAREEIIDIAARATGIDPRELRRINVVGEAEQPFVTATGMMFERVTPGVTLENATRVIDYDAFRVEQAAAKAEGRLLGLGIGLYIEPTSTPAATLGVEAAKVRLESGGGVTVFLGTAAHGQSIETTMAQVVAEHLGVEYDKITVVQGDTARTPFGGGTGGSRTAVIAGNATRIAALAVRDKVVEVAGHLLEAAPEDLEVADGVVAVKGTPVRNVSLAAIAAAVHNAGSGLSPEAPRVLEATGRYETQGMTWSNACHVCTVEVDAVTGQVEILRYVVSEDCGRMINPMVVEGQVHGGVVQGIGGVLFEHFVYDPDGNPLTTTFLDYLVPTAAEAPNIEIDHVVTDGANPSGVKGMGEGGAIGSVPAVFNAVADALASVGAKITEQPLSPLRIVEALEAAGA
ncbi:MAG: xanthine dehydrogenase family protein molybdopterin-binding subunit [Actinomycetes bacterium]